MDESLETLNYVKADANLHIPGLTRNTEGKMQLQPPRPNRGKTALVCRLNLGCRLLCELHGIQTIKWAKISISVTTPSHIRYMIFQ